MGNWGNTLDRWYHRAAVVVWPRDQAFANRAETSPAWALDELAAMASAGGVPGAQAAAATLEPFWDGACAPGTALEMPALRAAAKLPRDGARGDAGFGDLAADCAVRLRARLARPQRASGDLSIELPAGGCTCDLCDTLRVFAEDRAGAPSHGRSPRSAGSTSTPGSTPPSCPSPT